LTRNHFEPKYGYTLTDDEVDEIICSLAAYDAALRAIDEASSATDSPVNSSVTFPQIPQVSTVESPLTFPKTGQPR
jgi:hypothetical protein